MEVVYEWDIETWEGGVEDAEILDHSHADKLADYLNPRRGEIDDLRAALAAGVEKRLVLVRDKFLERAWAYVEDGKLPEWLADDEGRPLTKVPKRFHQELERVIRRLPGEGDPG